MRSASLVGQTRVICGVWTMTMPDRPTTATSRPSSDWLITTLSCASTSTLTPWMALPLRVAGQVLAQRREAADVVPADREPDGDDAGAPLALRHRLHHRVVDADLEQAWGRSRPAARDRRPGRTSAAYVSGCSISSWRSSVAARQTNMPEFHQYSPERQVVLGRGRGRASP